jgi:hypothetical protein
MAALVALAEELIQSTRASASSSRPIEMDQFWMNTESDVAEGLNLLRHGLAIIFRPDSHDE